MDFSIGQVVYSKRGRDKARPFIIIAIDGDYLFLTDGKLRLLEKPKKKKSMHVQPTNSVIEDVAGGAQNLKNSDIRKFLVPFQNN